MDEKPDKIVQHIESKRNELGRNLDELQNKVRETTDWRVQFEKHPYILMSAAMGGGMLLSSMVGGSSSRSRSSSGARRSYSMPQTSSYYMNQPSSPSYSEPSSTRPAYREASGAQYQRQKAWSTFENIKGALIGLAAAKAQDYLNEMLPGFREHFRETENQNRAGMGMGQQQRQEHNQSWNQPQQPQNWGQGPYNQPNWGEQEGPGRSFNQPQERWSGQPETWRHSGEHQQGQWPQERSWSNERNWERDRERQHAGAFENQPGFRR